MPSAPPDDIHYYDPAQGHGLAHDPFKAIVGPRPIGWISSCDRDGRVNLAPYSYFNAFHDKPPILAFGSSDWKDSVANVEATGEFVANLATRPLAEAMNRTSAPVAHGIDEFRLAGLTPAPCRQVRPPRVAESPTALECRLLQIVRQHDLQGRALDAWMVIGQVVGVHIARAYIRDGLFDTAAARPIMRGGYAADYFEATPETQFRMRRPTA
ncbi:MAG: flavin reductase family protein [Ferrovibrio sp.]|jgi:flavin reductase (DIM6/NTAB) family NADH-FMN oxidoreductase RutF|uniref:flavin reductase family protein n=1 Tax=Ferrovibrio sp. TaxID=1917215 RepID=UPI003918BC53